MTRQCESARRRRGQWQAQTPCRETMRLTDGHPPEEFVPGFNAPQFTEHRPNVGGRVKEFVTVGLGSDVSSEMRRE